MQPSQPEQPSPVAPIASGPQPESAVTSGAAGEGARVFDDADRALLTTVLNRLVPPHDDVPGAGDLDVAVSIERALAASPALRRQLLDGLRAIEIAAGADFVALDSARQDEVLRRVEALEPAFFAALVNHCYRGYYTHPRVLKHLEVTAGYPARPPQPLGHSLPPWDPTMLDRQRERKPFWRKT